MTEPAVLNLLGVMVAALLFACGGPPRPASPDGTSGDPSPRPSGADGSGADVATETPPSAVDSGSAEQADDTGSAGPTADAPGLSSGSAPDSAGPPSGQDAGPLSDGVTGGDAASGPRTCEDTGRSGWLGLPEASGAVRFPDGAVLVVGDSGLHGRARWMWPDGSEADVILPLDGPRGADGLATDDDLEGLSLDAEGTLHGLTSAGWLRRWRRVDSAFELLGEASPIAPDGPLACHSRAVNCGPNYEGLCLRRDARPPASGGTERGTGDAAGRSSGSPPGSSGWAACAGFAASKTTGGLVCLVPRADGGPGLEASGLVIPSGLPGDQLADCAFPEAGGEGLLLAGNLHAGSGLWWFDPVSGSLAATGAVGPPNQEAVVSTGSGTWRAFGDLQAFSSTSPWLDLTCGSGPARRR